MTHPMKAAILADACKEAESRYWKAAIATVLTPRWHSPKKLYHFIQQRHYATMANRYRA